MRLVMLVATTATSLLSTVSRTTAFQGSLHVSRVKIASSRRAAGRYSHLFSSSSAAMDESLLNCPKIPLADGTQHPAIGFGTYKVGFIPASASAAVAGTAPAGHERMAQECVADALSVGYRFLECAEFYGNEAEVGKAIKASKIPRDELFLCSKVWTTTIEKGPAAIRAQLDKTLKDLGTDYVDLYLIHWPVPGKHVEAYKTLEELKREGKIRGLGVSNYAWEDYVELKESGLEFPPLVNQIEINPFLYRKNTIDKFTKDGVVMQSYRSLRDGKAFDNPVLVEMAKSYNKTPAQILGRWCVQHGFVYVPKSVKKERMVENAQVFDFELSSKDMETLDNLTTPDAIAAFEQLYQKCVNRDTTKDGTLEGVKMDITRD
jgi:diketogulonate reductase-like aldo/keto reductase